MAYHITHTTDSQHLFIIFWKLWRVLGVDAFENKWLNRTYDILLNVFITIWYPIHLTVGLFFLPMKSAVFQNLSISITCIVCTFKYICMRWKLAQFQRIQSLFKELDERSQSYEEKKYFNEVTKKKANGIAIMFSTLYTGVNLMAVSAVLLVKERRLMYPAWFPFEWCSSSLIYWLAVLYQIVGVSMQIIQNLVNDSSAPVVFCLLGGHVRLLSMRVANIGHDPKKSTAEHKNDLKLCVEDHIKLLTLFELVEDLFSFVLCAMFASSSMIICTSMVYLIFYADNLPAYVYYSAFIVTMLVETFPSFYYGSMLQYEFESLPYAIFSSNWPEQKKDYRQDITIFMEMTLRKLTLRGGGIVSIQLDSFFAICKMSYSLFTVVLGMK